MTATQSRHRSLARRDTRAVRVLAGALATDGVPLDPTCPVCGREVDPRTPIALPPRRVASLALARPLLAANISALRTRGAVCDPGSHGPLRLANTVPDARADGWDRALGVPIDCGPDGRQLVPIQTASLPPWFVDGAEAGLAKRGGGA